MKTRTSAGIETVVGARDLDGRLAGVDDPVLSASAVAVVAAETVSDTQTSH